MIFHDPVGLKFEEKRLNENHPVHYNSKSYNEDHAVRLHYHNSLEINQMAGVKGFVQMEGQSIPLESLSLLIIPPGNLHSYRIKGSGGTIHVWHIGIKYYKYLKQREVEKLISRLSGPLLLTSPGDELSHSLVSLDEGSLIQKNAALLIFLNQLKKYLTPGSNMTSKDEFLHRIIGFLEQEYNREISLDDAADFMCLSRYHFSRKFKERSGSTFLDYLNNLRLEHSLDSLNKGISVERAAELVGFDDASYFIKRFRGLYGVTPGSYQKYLRLKEVQ